MERAAGGEILIRSRKLFLARDASFAAIQASAPFAAIGSASSNC